MNFSTKVKEKYSDFHVLLLTLGVVGVFASCQDDDNLTASQECPIAFSSHSADEGEVTRAAETLGRDFVVYGYKRLDADTEQKVFDGYHVWYNDGSDHSSVDNTAGYSYVKEDEGQSVKYWDFSASEYHFWGVSADEGAYSFTGEKRNILTLQNLSMGVGGVTPWEDRVYYSGLTDRKPIVDGLPNTDAVQLRFQRPYTKVRVQFYTIEPVAGSYQLQLSRISFGPSSAVAPEQVDQVYGTGSVRVTYPLTSTGCDGEAHETVEVVKGSLADAQDKLAFQDVLIRESVGTASNNAVTAKVDAEGNTFYYLLPMGQMNPDFVMSVCVNNDNPALAKTAVVPAAYMCWRQNYLYTYTFKIVGQDIEFYDVKIDPWKYGGNQEEEWRNW